MKPSPNPWPSRSGVLGGQKSPPRTSAKHDELRDAFEKSELGERHVAPLVALVIGGPASVSELAERIGQTPATTSLLVGELSRAGFVERREDDADRRRTIVSIDESIEEGCAPRSGRRSRPWTELSPGCQPRSGTTSWAACGSSTRRSAARR